MERTLPIRQDWTYESLTASFEWKIPRQVNMASVCVDLQPPERVALITELPDGTTTTTTFGEVAAQSSRLAGWLQSAGVGRGDVVAVIVPQSLETALVHLAAWKLGAVSVPIAALFGIDAIAYRLEHSKARVVVTDRDNEAKVREASPIANIVVVEDDFAAAVAAPPVPAVATSADDPAFLVYTSGTTGSPKGALQAHRSIYGHLPAFELFYEFAPLPGDVIWTPADWAWMGALMDVVMPAWFHGITVLTTRADFSPTSALELMARHEVTLTFLPPTALKMMRAEDAAHPDLRLRVILTGGEPVGAELHKWARERLGASVNEGYGQTECNLVIGNCGAVWPVRPGSMGRALPGHEVAVLNPEGDELIDEVGEICVRMPDPIAMLGYWNDSAATSDKIAGGWLRTGDLAVRDRDGYFWFKSRTDDIISSRGYRIGPGEIEECLMGHPAVAMAAVVGMADAVRGQVPAAFVVLRSGFEPDEALAQQLRDYVRLRLAAHEVPARVTFVDDLPRTTTGKVLRRALRDL